ncbi:hypothetical protein D3C83_16960 [compost metagenome]
MGRTGVSSGTSGIFAVWRSAKNMWRSAFDSLPSTRNAKRSRSNLRPSSKGLVAAASTQATISSGAGKPREALATSVRAFSKNALGSPSTFTERSRMRLGLVCFFAKAIAPSSKSPCTISSTSPRPRAFSAGIGLPVVIIWIACAAPTTRGRRCVPPEPGNRPSFTSGRPISDLGSATR